MNVLFIFDSCQCSAEAASGPSLDDDGLCKERHFANADPPIANRLNRSQRINFGILKLRTVSFAPKRRSDSSGVLQTRKLPGETMLQSPDCQAVFGRIVYKVMAFLITVSYCEPVFPAILTVFASYLPCRPSGTSVICQSDASAFCN